MAMADTPYWNPRHETMPRDQIEALQVRKLRALVDWADEQVPWQSKRLRDAGVTPDLVRSLDDLRRIPLMTREDWMQGQLDHPPYGPILAAPPERAIRYHTTSGTTGATPIRVLDSMKDWEWIAEMWCYGLWGFGVRPSDTVFVAFGYSTFIGFWGLHYASEKLGCSESGRSWTWGRRWSHRRRRMRFAWPRRRRALASTWHRRTSSG
jgi:phenylacetate-CoA ligase